MTIKHTNSTKIYLLPTTLVRFRPPFNLLDTAKIVQDCADGRSYTECNVSLILNETINSHLKSSS